MPANTDGIFYRVAQFQPVRISEKNLILFTFWAIKTSFKSASFKDNIFERCLPCRLRFMHGLIVPNVSTPTGPFIFPSVWTCFTVVMKTESEIFKASGLPCPDVERLLLQEYSCLERLRYRDRKGILHRMRGSNNSVRSERIYTLIYRKDTNFK